MTFLPKKVRLRKKEKMSTPHSCLSYGQFVIFVNFFFALLMHQGHVLKGIERSKLSVRTLYLPFIRNVHQYCNVLVCYPRIVELLV